MDIGYQADIKQMHHKITKLQEDQLLLQKALEHIEEMIEDATKALEEYKRIVKEVM